MKRFLIICIVIVMQVAVGASSFLSGEVKSCCPPITKTYRIPSSTFDKINVSSNANVKIVHGTGMIVVRINSHIERHLLMEVCDGELIIELDHLVDENEKPIFEVIIPYNMELKGISASGFVTVESDVILIGDDIIIKASGGSKIIASTGGMKCDVVASGAANVEIECRSLALNIKASGAATINVNVKSDKCKVTASGASDVILKGEVDQLNLELTESSDMSLRALWYDTIDLKRTGTGRLIYTSLAESKMH